MSQEAKVHFVGYSNKYDEWKPVEEIIDVPDDIISSSANNHFKHQLTLRIKEELSVARKRDSKVVISIPVQKEMFENFTSFGTLMSKTCSRSVYTIGDFAHLNAFLGENWHSRIVNQYGDSCRIRPGTAVFWLTSRMPLLEFVIDRNECKRKELNRGFLFKLKFVRECYRHVLN